MRRPVLAGAVAICLAWMSLPSSQAAPTDPSSTAAGNSGGAVVSGNGRYLAFVSEADNLVMDCHNGPITDVFVRDIERKETVLISGSLGGHDGGNRSSRAPSISADGRWIVFESAASDLVEGDTNGRVDVFLHDRTSGLTRRVSARAGGLPDTDLESGDSRNPVLTMDGQWVFFDSENALVADDANGQRDVYRYVVSTGDLEWISRAPEGESPTARDSIVPVVDSTGRRVAYRRLSSTSTIGIPTEGSDLMIQDFLAGTRGYLKSPLPGNADKYRFSADGRTLVAVLATSGGRHTVVTSDVESGSTTVIDAGSVESGRVSLNSFALTAEGRHVLLSWSTATSFGTVQKPTNSVWAWTPGETPTPLFIGSDPLADRLRSSAFDLSPDGEWIAFRLEVPPPNAGSNGLEAGAVYIRRREGGPLIRIAGDATAPQFLPNGTRLLIETGDSALVTADQNNAVDLILKDFTTESAELVSAAIPREEPEIQDVQLGPDPALITADGQKVFFVSYSEGLSPGDTNRSSDIFMRDLHTGALELISVAADGSGPGNSASFHPVITPDGMSVAFLSIATNLTAGEFQDRLEVFLRDRTTHTTRRVSEGLELPIRRAAINPGISDDGKRVLFEVYENSGKTQSFVWQAYSDGASKLIPVQGDRDGVNFDRVVQCRLSANGTRVAFLYPNSPAAAVLDLMQNRYLSLQYPGSAVPFRSHGIAISSSGREFFTEVQFGAGMPIQAVWHSDQGTSRLLDVHHSSDAGWNLGEIREIAFSPDDRFVVFTRRMVSAEPPHFAQRSDVFLHDLLTGGTTLISVNRHGTGPGNGFSRGPSVSSGGRWVAFLSDATDLVADDTNNRSDVFVRDLDLGVTRRIGATSTGPRRVHAPFLAAQTNRIVVRAVDPSHELGQAPGIGSTEVIPLTSPDRDHDGLDDDWELAFFGSSQGGAGDDLDEDGVTSLEEMIAGTLPDSPQSTLRLRLRVAESGSVRVEWDSVFGRDYELFRMVGALDQPPHVIRIVEGSGDPVIYQELQPLDETVTLYGVRVGKHPSP